MFSKVVVHFKLENTMQKVKKAHSGSAGLVLVFQRPITTEKPGLKVEWYGTEAELSLLLTEALLMAHSRYPGVAQEAIDHYREESAKNAGDFIPKSTRKRGTK